MAKKAAPLQIRNRITGMQFIRGKDLQDNSANWRVHPQHQREALSGILREVGIAGALLVYQSEKHGGLTVIDGHLRKGDFPDQEWPCLMTDLTDTEADYMLLVHDPLAAQAEAEKDLLRGLMEQVSSGEASVQAMISQMADDLGILLDSATHTYPIGDVPEPEIDRAEELREKWNVHTGQIWTFGQYEHRLLCGDATNRENVKRLFVGGNPRLMVTDPPYGVEYDANWRNEAADKGYIAHADRRVGKVVADDTVDWREAWALFPGDVVYCWHADRHASVVQASLEACNFEIRCQLIWAKQNFAISRGHYHWKHEPCWYAVRKGATAHWIGDHSQTTLWNITWDKNVEGGHSTQKPLECMSRAIRNHDAPEVYDPFLGSGTTLMACEQHNRRCYACEIDPGYVAVTLQRWADMTGEIPRLLEK